MTLPDQPQGSETAGAAWIDRFLLPHFRNFFEGRGSISCLQIAPDDSSEAAKLEALGYRCEMLESPDANQLPFPSAHFDFVFTGRFSSIATSCEEKIAFAKEIHRVLRPGGALLIPIGNRWCPLDLTRNGSMLHGPGKGATLSEMTGIFVHEAKFRRVISLNVHGHFGWKSLPMPLRLFGKIADAFWRFLATPERLWLYSSPLNPTLILWVKKE